MLVTKRVAQINGVITVPGDKSISHRAVMLASISQGKSVISGFLMGEDCLSTISCCKQLGIDIVEQHGTIEVYGKGINGLQEANNILDCGNSGTTMRLMSGILAGQNFLSVMTGDRSLRSRPMTRVVNPLRQMGAIIDGRNDSKLAPLTIRGGKLKGIEYKLPVASAQVKSAVLLAGLYAEGETTVIEETTSRDHTENMLRFFGGNVKVENGRITVGKCQLTGQTVEVPGDISSAAFFMAAAAAKPGSHITIKNVGVNPTRTGIVDVLRAMGADIQYENITSSCGEPVADIVVKGGKLIGTKVTKEIMPRLIDEVPIIAAIAAVAEGKTIITGAEELKVKESNRIASMVTELTKVGVNIKELEDGMEIVGPNKIIGCAVESYDDHRVAMSMAIIGLFSDLPVIIEDSACVAISFPGFYDKIQEITT